MDRRTSATSHSTGWLLLPVLTTASTALQISAARDPRTDHRCFHLSTGVMLVTVPEELPRTPENLKASSAAGQQPSTWQLSTRACNSF